MKFLNTLSTVLYALALGVSSLPVDNEPRDLVNFESRSLVPRAITETADYTKIKSIRSTLTPGVNYAFTIKWPINESEKNAKLKTFQATLGFSHIGLMVGHVVQGKNTGTASRPTYELDFKGTIFDLTGTDKVAADKMAWKASNSPTLTYVGTTTKSDDEIHTKGK
jgi:hypothetical protein